jgi:hypothetical protein
LLRCARSMAWKSPQRRRPECRARSLLTKES